MLLLFLAAVTAPVSGPCGAHPLRGVSAECMESWAAADFERVRKALPEAIDARSDEGLERSAEEIAAWKSAAAEVARLWAGFRDARCDPALLAYESGGDAAPCRGRISIAAAADLRLRYGLDNKSFGRANVEIPAAKREPSPEEAGPCAKAPPAECDYCGMNHCWEARLKTDDAALNAAWRRALARIGAKPGLTAAQRADWTARLRTSQRRWLRWRDEDCALERLETPNPNAHSIYALVTGPCLAQETEARTALLERTYGR
jgi:uncharacterized protein YecT (DUF1311 family)